MIDHIDGRLLRRRLTVVLLVVGLVLVPGTALAQDASPSVDLAGATIDVEGGETSTVTAEYEFEVASAGSGDEALSSIGGTMWQLPDRELGDISATVDGEDVEASVTEESRHTAVSVPVERVEDGDTVSVTLEYDVSGPAGEVRVPLWVPEYSTPGQANVVDLTVTLPEGTTVSGDSFPSPENVDGNVATYDLLHVPGFASAEYGAASARLVTTDTMYSIVGIVVIVGFIVGGLAIDRKTA